MEQVSSELDRPVDLKFKGDIEARLSALRLTGCSQVSRSDPNSPDTDPDPDQDFDIGCQESPSPAPSPSLSSSSSGFNEELESCDWENCDPAGSDDESWFQAIVALMALDLRKKTADGSRPLETDNDLKTTKEGASIPELVPISNCAAGSAAPEAGEEQQLSADEIRRLKEALKRLIRLLRLDSQPVHLRQAAIHQLISLLYLYLKKGGLDLFQRSFSTDRSIKDFVFLVCRVKREKTNAAPPKAAAFVRPSRAAQLSDDGFQYVERSPSQTRSTSHYRSHPYPVQHGANNIPARVQHQDRFLAHSLSGPGVWNASGSPIHQAAPARFQSSPSSPTHFNIPPHDEEGEVFDLDTISDFMQLIKDTPGLPVLTQALRQCLMPDPDVSSVPVAASAAAAAAADDLPYSPLSSASSPASSVRTPAYPSSPPDLMAISSAANPVPGSRNSRMGHRAERIISNWPPSPPNSLSPAYSAKSVAASPLSFTTGSPAPRSPFHVEYRMHSMSLESPNPSVSSSPGVRSPGPPPATARDEILASLDQVAKERSMRQVAMSKMEDLIRADADGDTPLMVACANPKYQIADLYALLERLKSCPNAEDIFTAINHENKSALFLAASENRPLVAGYLAETMTALGVRLTQTYEKGNTLIHYLAFWGDDFAQVLEYLVRVKQANGRSAFDLDARNHEGRSALHEAVNLHRPSGDHSYIRTISILVKHGANAGLSDGTSGKTPVHAAVEKRDPVLLRILLAACPSAANASMYNDNRPLHSAATLAGVNEHQQLELVKVLLEFGADKACRNKANKLPVELVQHGHDKVKGILQARSRQSAQHLGT